jgi:hypothetical protein
MGHGRLEGLGGEIRAGEWRDASGVRGDNMRLAGNWARRSGTFWPQLSNLPYYAATGVKAQAFVLVMFLRCRYCPNNLNNISML